MEDTEKSMSFASQMCLSFDTIVYVSRTTTSDIMCVTNTYSPVTARTDGPKIKTMKASASLPYKDSAMPTLPEGNTSFSQFRTVELKMKRNMEMKKERDLFFAKLETERKEKVRRENEAAVRIQALARGFIARPHPECVKVHVSAPLKIAAKNSAEIRQVQDELCGHAAKLGLRPIPGLSLETRSKHNKRKNKIELAASMRLQAFFRMTGVVLKMKKNMAKARIALLYDAATKIKRFIAYAGKKVRYAYMMEENQHTAATKLQTRFRMFQAFHR